MVKNRSKSSKKTKSKLRTPSHYKTLGIAAAVLIAFLFIYNLFTQKLGINLISSQIADTYDVVVVGAGTGGVSAAIQAARMGSSVILVEPTDWVGGQMSAAGVTSIDMLDPVWSTGIYKEYADKAKANSGSHTVNPKNSQSILRSMLAAEPKISLVTRTNISSIQKDGSQITGVTLSSGQNIKTKLVIDATEYGDIIAMSGANYRVGNTTNSAPNTNACIQDITYTAIIKKYPSGVPAELKIVSPPPGYNATVRDNFARIVSKNPAQKTDTFNVNYPVSWGAHNDYRDQPNPDGSKEIVRTGVNWANDYPAPVPYIDYSHGITLSTRYLTDHNYRNQINCEAKLKTIQFIYYAQSELGQSDWSIANDEGYDTPYNSIDNNCPNIPVELKNIEKHMPVIPYVRESIRLIGQTTLTAKDIKRVGNPPRGNVSTSTSIAIGEYGTDVRNCKKESDLETTLESLSDESGLTGPFQVPLGTLISNNIDGLIAAEKNLSVSRLVNGAIRVQPITMLTGQAAGALASLSAKKNLPPKSIDAFAVQSSLVEQRVMLFPFSDVIPSDPNFKSIQLNAARGILGGYEDLKFKANIPVSREQVAILLTKAFGLTLSNPPTPTFEDVPSTSPSYKYVEALYRHGITGGCSASPRLYCPTRAITNAEIAIFMLRSLAKHNPNIVASDPPTPTYTDVDKSHFAYKFIEGLAANGIKFYCDNNKTSFCPSAVVSRGDISKTIDYVLSRN